METEDRRLKTEGEAPHSGAESRECGMKSGIRQGTPAYAGDAGLKVEGGREKTCATTIN